MRTVSVEAPTIDLDGSLIDFDEARFAAAWDGAMLPVLAGLQAAFASLFEGGGGWRITVALPDGSGAVALMVAEGLRALARSAALAWAAHGIEVECIPPST